MRFLRLIVFSFIFVTTTIAVAAQDHAVPQATKLDEFGDICCDAERARLENLIVELQKDPTVQGYVIFYAGRLYDSCWYGGKRYGKRRPRRGEAQARAARIVPYLMDRGRLDSGRIVVVEGGYRESWTAELWIVPSGANPPTASPTVDEKDVRYRKGRVTLGEFARQCEYIGG